MFSEVRGHILVQIQGYPCDLTLHRTYCSYSLNPKWPNFFQNAICFFLIRFAVTFHQDIILVFSRYTVPNWQPTATLGSKAYKFSLSVWPVENHGFTCFSKMVIKQQDIVLFIKITPSLFSHQTRLW